VAVAERPSADVLAADAHVKALSSQSSSKEM
jgi:hypothetical protein